LKKINDYNQWAEANGVETRMGVNEFSDMDSSEFLATHTGFVSTSSQEDKSAFKNSSIVFSPKASVATVWGIYFSNYSSYNRVFTLIAYIYS
jgi:hypothetical protein